MKKVKNGSFLLALLALSFFLAAGTSFSQTTLGTLVGTVADDQGTGLPGATVIVKNEETGYTYNAITQADGRYIISGIQPGRYEIEVSLSGFSKEKKTGQVFNVGARMSIDFSMKLAALDTVITVTGAAPMVEVTKSEISSVVDRQKIENLPLLGRNFADLTVMKAGVIGERSNAMSTGMEEVLVDGMSNENIIQNTNRLNLPADAIEEFRVMTNQFEAEYGNTGGMVRTAITRSGTNALQGRVSYFKRDEALDTPNYFVNHAKYKGEELPKDQWTKAAYTYDNVASFIGGPIKRDKAHFFLSYDGFFRTYNATITATGVPRETIEVPETVHLGLAKLSYQINQKNLLAFRFSLNQPLLKNQGVGGLNTKERAFTNKTNGLEFQLNWTFYPSDNTMNEMRAIYVINDNNFDTLPEFEDKYSIVRPGGNFGKNNNFPQYNFADRYQIVDNFSLFLGSHTVKAGIDFMYIPSGVSRFDMYIPGEYTFTTNNPFDANDRTTYPFMFMSNKGDPAFRLELYELGAFVQDSWRIHPRLTLNYGLRYNMYDYSGLDLKKFDIKNFNPRLAFSWDPIGDGKTSIRGGVGTYTANPMANIGFPAVFYKKVKLTIIYNPGYPDPSKPNPFITAGEGAVVFDDYQVQSAPLPYSVQVTLGGQRELFTDFSVGMDLVWTKGNNLITWENNNPVIVGTTSKRKDPTKGSIWVITNRGKSDFKGLYLNVNKRYSHGWSLEASYTLGRQMGNTEGQDRPWSYEDNAWDRAWGRKNTDARHQLVVTGIVDLPLGFQLSGLFQYRSAYPWNAIYPYDQNKDGLLYTNAAGDYVDEYRNSREGLDFLQINARISKFFKFSRFRFQVFGEVYNLTNRANFYNVFNRFGLTGFGEPRSAFDPRIFVLGARFDF